MAGTARIVGDIENVSCEDDWEESVVEWDELNAELGATSGTANPKRLAKTADE